MVLKETRFEKPIWIPNMKRKVEAWTTKTRHREGWKDVTTKKPGKLQDNLL
jgi:hypothetical protein